MKADQNFVTVAPSLSSLTPKQDRTLSSIARCNLEVAMSYNEAADEAAQKYYNKACGCSVKAQEDNLFDYNLVY